MNCLKMCRNRILEHKVLLIAYFICVVGVMLIPVNILSRLFLLWAGTNFYICLLYYGNVFNLPGLFMTTFLLQIGCSQAKLTAVEQQDFLPMTWVTIFTVIVLFYAVVIVFSKWFLPKAVAARERKKTVLSGRTILWINILLTLVELPVYAIVYWKLGTLPMFNDEIRAITMPAMITNVGITFMVLPQFLIIINTVYAAYSRKYQMMGFSVLYVALLTTMGGRINLFIPVVTALLYLLIEIFRDKTRMKELLRLAVSMCCIVGILMVGMPLLRVQSNTESESGTTYYNEIYSNPSNNASVDNKPVEEPAQTVTIPSALLPVWVNFSTELHGFNTMVEALEKGEGSYQYGRCFLTGTLNFVCKYFVTQPEPATLSKISFINICTFMQEPYYDFGVYGVALFVLLYAIGGMLLYRMVLARRSLFTTLYYAYYAMATIFLLFANHFYYSTFVINTVLLWLVVLISSKDWIGMLTKKKTANTCEKSETEASV